MRLSPILAFALALTACAHKEKAPAPLPPHPVGTVSSGALPPPAELSAPATASESKDQKSGVGQ